MRSLQRKQRETISRSKEPTFVTTASGEAELTERATVSVDDLDVFVTMMLLEDSPAVLTVSGFIICRNGPLQRMEKGRVSIVEKCESNEVQV